MLNPPPVDLHLHLLPNVDDGPSRIDECEAMFQFFAQLGVRRLAATPHLHGPLDERVRSVVERGLEAITPLALQFGIAVTPGFEVLLTPDVPQRLIDGEPIGYAGTNAILVELPFEFWPEQSASIIFEIQTAEYQPVLAHPERYVAAQQDPKRVLELAERGVIMQVTYASLAGVNGRSARSLAEQIIRVCPKVILATDAHGNGTRLRAFEAGLARATETVGSVRAAQMAAANPASILANQPFPIQAPLERKPEQRSFFGRAKRNVSGWGSGANDW
jgi:protein-tyrosine phosphatase